MNSQAGAWELEGGRAKLVPNVLVGNAYRNPNNNEIVETDV